MPVPELLINATEATAIMYDLSPTFYIYMMVFLISAAIGMSIAFRFSNAIGGAVAFVGILTMFSFFDLFPLWLIAVPAIILVGINFYLRESNR